MIAVLTVALSLCIALTALSSFMTYRWWQLSRLLRISEMVTWKTKAEAVTARSELADALQRESIARDNAALYKAKLNVEQLAMLREQRKVSDGIKTIQAIGTDQQRVDAGLRVLRGINAAKSRDNNSDEDRTPNLRKPAAKPDSPEH